MHGKNFFVTGGTLHPGSPSYVEREADKGLFQNLERGEFCYVLTSRQMGKSSLMLHTAQRLRQAGFTVAVLDLTAIGQNLTAEQWYDGLMAKLGVQLELEDELMDFWRSHEQWGPLQRFMTALEQTILPRVSSKSGLVVFVDEIDLVQSLLFSTDEFFAAIRECYNRRAQDPRFRALTFCLLGVASPNDLIRDSRMTPFNIGARIELTDFTPEEAEPLVKGFARLAPEKAETILGRVLYWTHGHPYLTQRLCRMLAEQDALDGTGHVDGGCEELFLSSRARARDDNLLFVRERMLAASVDTAAVLACYERVLNGAKVPDEKADRIGSHLHLAGIVRAEEGWLRVRNRIYQTVFNKTWVRQNLPESEVLRQKKAFRRGAVWAGATVIVLFAAAFALLIWQKSLLQKQSLGDGSTLILNAVTYGKHHRFEPGVLRLGWLSDLFPTLRRHLGGSVQNDYGEDVISIWFSRRDGQGRAMGDWWGGYRMLDEHGCVLEEKEGRTEYFFKKYGGYDGASARSGPGGFSPTTTAPRQHIIGNVVLTSYPRHMKDFKLQLLKTVGKEVVQFRINNPAVTPAAIWVTEALPSVKQTGDMTFTFKEWSDNPPEPKFEVTRAGRSASDWQPIRLRFVDSSGNFSSDPARLCRYEPAWKVSAEFFRTAASHFETNEIWIVPEIPVPGPGSLQPLGLTNTLNGAAVSLIALGGVGNFSYAGSVPKAIPGSTKQAPGILSISGRDIQGGLPHLAFDLAGLRNENEFTFWGVDDQKRNVGRGPSGSSGENFHLWTLNIPEDAKTVALMFAVHRGRAVEFTVRPPPPPASGNRRN